MPHAITATTPRSLPAPQPKVYSYSRWSTPEQAKGDSSRRQADAAARWAEKRGYRLDDALKITDEGVSAYRGGNASDSDRGLSRFLDACRRGLIEPGSFLLVESLDRISRMAPRKAQRLIDDIVDNEVTIVTLSDDQHYTAERLDNDPTALLISLMVSWRAHEESKTKGRRVADAWREKRRQVRESPTMRLTSRGPSWLIPTATGWEEDKQKADTVRRIYSMTLAGEGEHRIAAIFNEERVPVLARGTQWHRSTVSKLLRTPAVIGTLVPGFIADVGGRRRRVCEEPVLGAFPPIISEADWLAVRALKDGKAGALRGRHAGKAVAHLLAGLARCPACAGSMSRVNKGARTKAGSPKLVCNAARTKAGCRYVSVSVEAIETAFLAGWGVLFENIPSTDSTGELDAHYRAQQAAIWGTEDHLGNLVEALERSPSDQGARAVARVEAELRGMRVMLEEIDERRSMADRGLIRARMDQLFTLLAPDPEGVPELDRTAINAALKVLFRAAVVDYETGRVAFQWRQGGETSLVYAWVD